MIIELDLLENALNDNTVASVNHLYKWLERAEWDLDTLKDVNQVWDKEEERSRLIRLATSP